MKFLIFIILASSVSRADVTVNYGKFKATYPNQFVADICSTAIHLGWLADDMGSIDMQESDRLFEMSDSLSKRAAFLVGSDFEDYCF